MPSQKLQWGIITLRASLKLFEPIQEFYSYPLKS